uniref:Phosphatidylinositol-3,4,5-trisphosphate 3-phosphatase n=1 Tax=Amphora coffeiformis TaxID=265554 RepID=A0A7S3LC95_9STRA|mmetsp:Transcript_9222/g.17610  ORF Transcript_9222/g.17610 Transcript_9222/m.17610 type:complete len:792 (-) Transcript_9222:75-2450(-)|eukprot:scaffold2353_cov167-Amphora_coffeaeformis.AAC.59
MWSSWSDAAKNTWKTAADGVSGIAHPKPDETKPAEGDDKGEGGVTAAVAGEGGETGEGAKQSQPTTPKPATDIFKNFQSGWSSVLENTQQSITKIVPIKKPHDPVGEEPSTITTGRYAAEGADAAAHHMNHDLLKNFQSGWTTVMEQTKQGIKTAQSAVEAEQQKMAKRIQRARTALQKRDPKLPLDVPALRDAQVVYITDRLITLSHPAMASSQDGDITADRKLAAVGHLLQRRHDGRFMLWNLSEVDYDTGLFDDQVLNFSFPGSPSPPLGLMLKLLVSMESWLKADERNVAVVHCLTGKGRTSTVLAAFLCWMGEAGFGDIYQALDYISKCKKITPEELTIPSQRRYASYFKNMLDGVRPSQPPLMLKRVIMSVAPKYAKGPPRESDGEKMDDTQLMGCAPYLQIFKAGSLIHTAPASLHFQQSPEELPFCRVSDGQISFQLNQVVQGDILLRCRHLTARKQRVSMFRAAFHTGYAPPNVMRINKSQLDGACTDDHFPDDFYIDVIFEPIDAEAASQVMNEGEAHKEGEEGEHPPVEAHGSKEAQALAGGAQTVRASSYDVMLHRDSRFWEVIAKRNEAHKKDEAVSHDPMYGPTVGRRREFGTIKKTDGEKGESSALQTFSIGNEFDFLPSDDPKPAAPVPVKPAAGPPKRDTLMEALMGALDEGGEGTETETIVFHTGDDDGKQKASSAPPSMGVPPLDKKEDAVSVASSDAKPGDSGAAAGSTDGATDTEGNSGDGDMDALLADANMELDDDMDALLAGVDDDGDFMNDDMDADLEDLENFLSQK